MPLLASSQTDVERASSRAGIWEDAQPRPGGLSRGRFRLLTLALMAAWSALLLFLFTQYNGFPADWTYDEPTKVAQIVSGKENFHHPQLMLRATDVVLWLTGGVSPQQIVVAGRWVSAIAAVAAVDLLALLAICLAGRLAGYLTALMVGTSPLLFGLAHYMKEDAVYVFGLAAVLLLLKWYEEAPTGGRLALLGMSAGLATSAKYLGAITIPLMLAVIFWTSRDRPVADVIKRCALALALVVAVFLLVDFSMLAESDHARWAFEAGIIDVINSHGGLFRPVTSAFYLEGLIRLCTPLVLGSYVWWLVTSVKVGWRSPLTPLIVALLPIGYLLLLQFTPVKIIRYELPPIMIMTMLAACCLARLFSDVRPRWMRAAAIGVASMILLFNIWSIAQSRAAIVSDTRAEMARWISGHLARDAVLLQDRLAGLAQQNGTSGPSLGAVPVRVITLGNEPAILTLDVERSAGVTHVLVDDLLFGRFFNPSFRTDTEDPKAKAVADRARAFYRELFAAGTLVHHIEGANPAGTFFSPGLWLFSIEPNSGPALKAAPPTVDLLED